MNNAIDTHHTQFQIRHGAYARDTQVAQAFKFSLLLSLELELLWVSDTANPSCLKDNRLIWDKEFELRLCKFHGADLPTFAKPTW